MAVIDAEDAAAVGKYLWCWNPDTGGADGYAVTNAYLDGGPKQVLLKLHRFLIDPPESMEVDHRNRDRLDNRRDNLRICTRIQNSRNSERRTRRGRPLTTMFRGVSFALPYRDRYRAYINADSKNHYLGTFRSPLAAALAYDRAAKRLHGEFAITNF